MPITLSILSQKDFSVDEFLAEHRRIANLETLRDDLGLFLKKLRSSTIKLINKDYADFVELSSNLIALEQDIMGIEDPLNKIKKEIMAIKTVLDEKINKIMKLENQRKQTRNKMQSIKSIFKIQSNLEKLSNLLKDVSDYSDHSASILKLEHALNEINQYYFYSKQCDTHLKEDSVKEFDKLFEYFLFLLKDIFLKSIKSEEKSLKNCLHLYFTVNKVSLAHEIVRESIVSPTISKIISEDSLQNEPGGLEKLYSKVLLSINRDLKYLLNLTQDPSKDVHVKGFDFMIHSVWPEIEERLELNLKSIYSPGNPDTFFKCYMTTLSFLDKLEEYCITDTSVSNLRNLKSYQNFLHYWNLPVYYTLRFQELGGRLEKIIHTCKYNVTQDSADWKLGVSEEVWWCLLRCWDDDIFIRQLAHRFWKFNLQVLARFQVWIQDMNNVQFPSQVPVSKLDFFIYLYMDASDLIDKLPIILQTARSRIGSDISVSVFQNMQKCLQETKENLQSVLKAVEQKIISLISEKNISLIRQVNDIPRLYRRTNRETPTQPCSYVTALFAPIYELKELHSNYTLKWIPSILSAITYAYYEQVAEVLMSVQRTEESLRKFKKIRDPLNLDSKNNTDDDKIRLQLQIDIQHYINTVKSFSGSVDNVNKLQDLDDILKKLHKNA